MIKKIPNWLKNRYALTVLILFYILVFLLIRITL